MAKKGIFQQFKSWGNKRKEEVSQFHKSHAKIQLLQDDGIATKDIKEVIFRQKKNKDPPLQNVQKGLGTFNKK